MRLSAMRAQSGPSSVPIVMALMWRQLYALAPLLLIVLPVAAMIVFSPDAAVFAVLSVVMIPTRFGSDFTEYALPASARQIRTARVLMSLVIRWSPSLIWLLVAAPRGTIRVFGLAPATVVAMTFALAALPEALDRWIQWMPAQLRFMVSPAVAFIGLNAVIFAHDAPITTIVWLLVAFSVLGIVAELQFPPRTPTPDVPSNRAMLGGDPGAAVEHPATVATIGEGLRWRDYLKAYLAMLNRTQIVAASFPLLMFALPSQQFFLGLAMVSSQLLQPIVRLPWLALLPVRTRARVAINAAPPVFLAIAIMLMQQLHIPYFRPYLEMGAPLPHDSKGTYWDSPSRLPLTYWTLLPGDGRVLIRAPWGETSVAQTVSVLGRRYVNLFTVNRTSSERFRDWQRIQMTGAVYGREVSARELRDGPWYPRVTESWRMLLLQGSILLSWLLLVVAISVRQPVLSYVAGSAPLLLMFVELARDDGSVFIPLLQKWLLSINAALPIGIFVIALAALPVALMLGALWYVTARANVYRQLQHTAMAAGLQR